MSWMFSPFPLDVCCSGFGQQSSLKQHCRLFLPLLPRVRFMCTSLALRGPRVHHSTFWEISYYKQALSIASSKGSVDILEDLIGHLELIHHAAVCISVLDLFTIAPVTVNDRSNDSHVHVLPKSCVYDVVRRTKGLASRPGRVPEIIFQINLPWAG